MLLISRQYQVRRIRSIAVDFWRNPNKSFYLECVSFSNSNHHKVHCSCSISQNSPHVERPPQQQTPGRQNQECARVGTGDTVAGCSLRLMKSYQPSGRQLPTWALQVANSATGNRNRTRVRQSLSRAIRSRTALLAITVAHLHARSQA